ncbi:uncharacterized protein B0J16DRAFT_324250 [Fusarium flagelliforme]|uniref:uncharacterized protein n=1 Tax=Fusarium flagelliforme TaxID=2675880 RepID=UPI001E8DB258|nr:uncharacterized protein B0J16DRAFT_324250 [Fusarium flagelliforme]KAH7174790.1 hypothetical protein B0J16DRAFT_324250 [Fusarium flagelliforme]
MDSAAGAFAPEIWDAICSHLTPPTLANLRLACRNLNTIALPWKFQTIRLEAFLDLSVERFIKIAETPSLCTLVRDLTIDTRVELEWEYNCSDAYPIPIAFMNALPYLRYFTNVRALHIRFEEHCGNPENDLWATNKETYAFRYKILDTIFHCAMGMWTLEKQLEIDQVLDAERLAHDEDAEKCDYDDQDLEFPGRCFRLRELTIANLADYSDSRITGSEAWKTLMALPSLVDLELFIATQQDEATPEDNSIVFVEKYDFFKSLPSTWLCPDMTQRLRVLSLYFKEHWGWFPIMDFRNCGEKFPFPRLKVLALGNYVFTHEWQIEWFSKLGSENRSGGLEELYLDDCPILHHARQNDVCEGGYPDTDAVLNPSDYDPSEHYFYIRWYSVLSHWKDSMKGLKVFRMGQGTWYGYPMETYDTITDDPDYADMDTDVLEYRLSHNVHRNFAYPAPDGSDPTSDEYRRQPEKWRHGEGLNDRRESRLTYIDYDIGMGHSAWLETSKTEGTNFEPEEGTAERDDVAWDAMMAAIEARR